MKEFFKKIGTFFSSLFNAAERTWNKIPSETRQAIVDGSGVISFINEHIDDSVEDLTKALQAQYPTLSTENMEKVAAAWNLPFDEGDLVSIVGAIQAHLKPLEGKIWAGVSDGLARVIAGLTSPEGTKYAVISSLMEFAYQKFIKPKP